MYFHGLGLRLDRLGLRSDRLGLRLDLLGLDPPGGARIYVLPQSVSLSVNQCQPLSIGF